MFTSTELESLPQEELRDAINKLLRDVMLKEGKIQVDKMTGSDIESALYLLRHYRAMRLKSITAHAILDAEVA